MITGGQLDNFDPEEQRTEQTGDRLLRADLSTVRYPSTGSVSPISDVLGEDNVASGGSDVGNASYGRVLDIVSLY
jgi:hypothetical protein